jgi:hypothetical protein
VLVAGRLSSCQSVFGSAEADSTACGRSIGYGSMFLLPVSRRCGLHWSAPLPGHGRAWRFAPTLDCLWYGFGNHLVVAGCAELAREGCGGLNGKARPHSGVQDLHGAGTPEQRFGSGPVRCYAGDCLWSPPRGFSAGVGPLGTVRQAGCVTGNALQGGFRDRMRTLWLIAEWPGPGLPGTGSQSASIRGIRVPTS